MYFNTISKTGIVLLTFFFIIESVKGSEGSELNQIKAPASGFIENQGQIIDQNGNSNEDVRFFLPGQGMNLQLREGGFSYDTYVVKPAEHNSFQGMPDGLVSMEPIPGFFNDKNADNEWVYYYHRVDVNLKGADKTAEIIPSEPFNYHLNYYTSGTDAEFGATQVQHYRQVTYRDIYPGIDLVFHLDPENTQAPYKYDFVVHPGADPEMIELEYSGMDGLVKADDHTLDLTVAHGTFSDHIPASYELNSGTPVNVTYSINELGNVTFVSEEYNKKETLVIDPAGYLAWGTYFNEGAAYSMDHDVNGYLYVAGRTESQSIATSGAHQDTIEGSVNAFLSKFDMDGQPVWTTYYGSNETYGHGVAVTDNGNVFLAGRTSGSSHIATTGAHNTTQNGAYDGFLAMFDDNGVRSWGTYFGGLDRDEIWHIAADANDNVYLLGSTQSVTGIATLGSYNEIPDESFIAAFDAQGQQIWGAYVDIRVGPHEGGIATGSGNDLFIGGNIEGATAQSNLVTTGSHQETTQGSNAVSHVVFAKFHTDGTHQWGSYYGGDQSDLIRAVSSDNQGNLYIAGAANSSSHIATTGTFMDSKTDDAKGFLAMFDDGGNRQWGTYYGNIHAVTTDAGGYIYISGKVSESSVWGSTGSYQQSGGGSFLARMNDTGNREWGTYYGGDFSLYAISAYDENHIYTGGKAGTMNEQFTTPNAYMRSGVSQNDHILLARFSENPCDGNYMYVDIVVESEVSCYGDSNAILSIQTSELEFQHYGGTAPFTYSWNTGGDTRTIENLPEGTYNVTITDAHGCEASNSIVISQPDILEVEAEASQGVQCFDEPDGIAFAQASGGTGPYQYYWSDGSVGQTAAELAPGEHVVTVEDVALCTSTDTVDVPGPDPLEAIALVHNNISCYENEDGFLEIEIAGGTSPYNFEWEYDLVTEDTLDLELEGLTLDSLLAGSYTILISDANGCTSEETFEIIEPEPLTPQVNVLNHLTCAGTPEGVATVVQEGLGGYAPYSYEWSSGETTDTAFSLFGDQQSVIVTDSAGCTASRSFLVEPRSLFTMRVTGPDTIAPQDPVEYQFQARRVLDNFSWSINGGDILTDENRNKVTVAWDENQTSGWISVEIERDGCIENDTLFVVIDPTVSLTEFSPELERFEVYPNPANKLLNIKVQGFNEGASLVVFDALGRKVYGKPLQTEQTIDVSEMEPGVYIIRAGNQHRKVIIEE